jgi:integral membrane protein
MSTTTNHKIRQWAHRIGIWEGFSYLILLFIAMPLKYKLDKPEAVRWMGSAHGFLFVLFAVVLLYAWNEKALSLRTILKAFILSLIPFGTFFLAFDKSVD